MFSKQIFFLIFHDGPQGWKHDKFKSKKQIFMDLQFFLQEALKNPKKSPCKMKNHLCKKIKRNGHLKVFGCQWLNFAALWWLK